MFYNIGFQKNDASRFFAVIFMSMMLIACGGEETEAEATTNSPSLQTPQNQIVESGEQEQEQEQEDLGDTLVDQNPVVDPIQYVPHQETSEEPASEDEVAEEPVAEEEQVAQEPVTEEEQVAQEPVTEEEQVAEEPVTEDEQVAEEEPQSEQPQEPALTSIELNWDIPVAREDGSDLELFEIDGYVVAYGTDSENLDAIVSIVGSGQTNVLIEELSAGTYYFAIATVDVEGNQGAFSETIEQVVL